MTLENTFVVPYLEAVLEHHTEAVCECLLPPRAPLPAPTGAGSGSGSAGEDSGLENSSGAWRRSYLDSEVYTSREVAVWGWGREEKAVEVRWAEKRKNGLRQSLEPMRVSCSETPR